MSAAVEPPEPSFGVVAAGFTFRRSIQLCNRHTLPERIRVSAVNTSPDDANVLKVLTAPKTLAPGMATLLLLELHAYAQRHSVFIVQISSPLSSNNIVVTASVVQQDLFDSLSDALKHEGRTVLDSAVKLGNRLPEFGESTTPTGSAATLTDEEGTKQGDRADRTTPVPLSPATYWDPWERMLKLDPQLITIETNPQWDLETAKQRNEERRNQRLTDLESMGMITIRNRKGR